MRYKREFDRYIASKGYDFRTLVAFSGTLVDEDFDPERELTEAQLNGGIPEKDCCRSSPRTCTGF